MRMQSHFARWIEAEVEPEDLEDLYKEVMTCASCCSCKEDLLPYLA